MKFVARFVARHGQLLLAVAAVVCAVAAVLMAVAVFLVSNRSESTAKRTRGNTEKIVKTDRRAKSAKARATRVERVQRTQTKIFIQKGILRRGRRGLRGGPGPTGVRGPRGHTGSEGLRGPDGSLGPAGNEGAAGRSLTREDLAGYCDAHWECRGAPGPPGADGAPGPPGPMVPCAQLDPALGYVCRP